MHRLHRYAHWQPCIDVFAQAQHTTRKVAVSEEPLVNDRLVEWDHGRSEKILQRSTMTCPMA